MPGVHGPPCGSMAAEYEEQPAFFVVRKGSLRATVTGIPPEPPVIDEKTRGVYGCLRSSAVEGERKTVIPR
ncbi:hypothetical protein CHCC15087_1868 [Bacillus licheniformis]|uniref:Uncharacterized protein n=2 Tax=Bacillus glycinifermentans TaxID=1664069 RepID=A0A2I7ZJI3_9BACI|nr:hypothetical protein [Bacillus glycinifermentans]AUS92815.1 hypothetical protein [Bacillus glycinifermentans]TWM22094.1 hypothetical protein CHCC15087_1868 [Bacillus licheniformis]